MKIVNDLLLNEQDVALSQNSDLINLDHIAAIDVTATIAANNPANTTFDTGTMEVQTFTFPAKAGITDGLHVIFYEPDGTAWAFALDTDGTTAPSSSSAWDAVAGANKVVVDCTSTTDAASVAAAVEAAVDGLTGFTSVITTDDTAADGTMTFTQIVPGNVSDAVVLDDAGAAETEITVANTTQGTATEVDLADSVSIPSHGYLTGMKITELTTTGTLPAGLATSTVYYVIRVDADNIKFATSQSNALAGTAVNITDYGSSTGVHTVVVETTLAGSVKLQKNNEPKGATGVWVDIDDDEVLNTTNSQNFAAAGNLNWVLKEIGFRALRAVVTTTSGTAQTSIRINGKGV